MTAGNKVLLVGAAVAAAAAAAAAAQTPRLSPWFSGTEQTPTPMTIEYKEAPPGQDEKALNSKTTAHDPDARFVYYQDAKRIVELLNSTDKAVEVVKDASLPFGWTANDDAATELEDETRLVEVALVVKVLDVRGRLTEEQDWIRSDVDVEIESVQKDTTGTLVPGMKASFPIDGGELKVGNRRVLARKSWEVLPKRGHRYLYFFGITKEGSLFPDTALHTFEVVNGKLDRLSSEKSGALDRDVSVDWATSAIRSKAHLPKKGGVR